MQTYTHRHKKHRYRCSCR